MLDIRKLTVEINPISVMIVGKPLWRAQPILDIREPIVEKNHITVKNVGNPSGKALALLNIRESILEKSVMNVGRLFLRAQPSNNIRKFITERAPRCSVVNHAEVIYYFWSSKRRNSINYTFNKNILCISILETFSLVRMFIITWLGLVKYFKNLNIYQYGNSYYRILCSKGEEWGRALYTAIDISPRNLVKLKKESCRKSIYCGLT